MSSIASTNASAIADLTEFLSSSASPLSSAGLSSSQVQSILKDASPSDIVQLSDQALQFQQVNAIFGIPDSPAGSGLFALPSSSSDSLQSILANLATGSAPTTSNVSPSSSTLATQLASYQGAVQAETAQVLLGTGGTSGLSGTLLNVLA